MTPIPTDHSTAPAGLPDACGTGYISSLTVPDTGRRRRLALLGATGSIGVSTLRVAAEHPDAYEVFALAGATNIRLLAEQAAAFRPAVLAVLTEEGAKALAGLLPAGYRPDILVGPHGYAAMAAMPEVDLVVSAIVGAAGLTPTLAAVAAGKIVALANKESLVLAGDLIRTAAADSGAVILPVDSEHNALFQALGGAGLPDLPLVEQLVLTASGGPFRGTNRESLEAVTPAMALNHPNWSMGPKISVDSATLMNKGLEVIEACRLYGLPVARVEVVVHPQSIVHSLAQLHDGSLLAHLGPPDMRVAIAYCLGYPRRLSLSVPRVDLVTLASLTFEAPREDDFPCLGLARQALAAGSSHTVALNAANEVAVDLFLNGRLRFMDIPAAIAEALSAHAGQPLPDAAAVMDLDVQVRREVADWAKARQ
ncbi:1-deoxy-D-xylulose 5-phosphate reductoisomerase [Desulfovibrio sp. DV]|uniref:1-deoxy-D-xylulose-5-phosphate reductoisomerase n=1 Tax=Desulfovibrio sp. DV TaxID=1844708 RepID=UPI00094BC0F7|nr:1-deoxy-D-xylulose-5-phosphate reductoisomerase [Desulfovibrio sp. DV]OLN27896.1 1-deoxy-D-xylulose 5-phosphate reductoisomerase [Desulfovibrio sp. DV]